MSAPGTREPPVGHEVVLASAGTGKTFRLTSRFIAHLAGLPSADDCAGILATTFTRKAAGEILGKVLERLMAAVESPDGLEELCRHTGASLTRERCLALLLALTRNLHRLNVLTIDALFMRIAAAFTLELGVPPGWRIADDEEDADLRAEAIREALEEGEPDRWLDLLLSLHGGEAAGAVHDTVLRRVDEAYEAYLLTGGRAEVWERFGPEDEPLDEPSLAAAIRALEDAPLATRDDGEPDARWERARRADLEAARAGDWDRFLSKGLAAKAADGSLRYHDRPFPSALAGAYEPLVAHAAAVILARFLERNRAVHELMRRFDAAYTRLKRARGLYRFDDIPRLLLARAGGDLEHLYYRLDAAIRHVLLDEFQDTSVTQFRLLEPILEELLSAGDGRTVFCVGDVKQSLYVWRDAEPELLPGLLRRWPQLARGALDLSFRSSPVITDTVNHVFEDLPNNPALAGQPVAGAWAGRFRSHSSARNDPGAACLLVAPATADADGGRVTSADRAAEAMRFAAQRVRRIVESAPGATVGVLVRTNKHIATLIYELRRVGVDASQEGGNTLMDAPPVAAAVSLMQLADHPGDTAAYYHVATSPIGEALGLALPIDERRARRLAARLRQQLMDDGYAATLRRLLANIAPAMDERGYGRFEQLIDLAQEFDERAGTRPAEFVRLVRQRGVEEPGRQNVRVMSIHKSKGLEFDAVVLPDLDRPWRLLSGTVLLDRPSPFEPVAAATVYPEKGICRLHAGLAALHQRATDRLIGEELCCLYVAMTRARYALEMIVQPDDGRRESTPSAAAVLRGALAPDQPAEPESELWRSEPFQGWAAEVETRRRAAHEAPEPRTIELRLRPGAASPVPRWKRLSPSSLEGAGRATLADLLSLDERGARDRGSLVHAWLELVEWLDDGLPTEAQLLDAAHRTGFDRTEALELASWFRAALAGDAGAPLRRTAYTGRPADAVEVRREWAFSVCLAPAGADGSVRMEGRFDRLVLGRRAGRVAWADLIDFKTDRLGPRDGERFARRVAFYTPQIRAYRRAIAAMFGLPQAAITASLLFVESGVVQPVGDGPA